jgi:dolichyl-phosphate beta-glucosyltransferase
MSSSPFDVSVVLPAYNAAAYIGRAVDELQAFFARHDLRGEVVIADDGSVDGTSAAVTERPTVRVVRLPMNRGKGAAIRTGMRKATGAFRVFTDADLPYGTDPILVARRYINERGFHAVVGDRTLPGSSYKHEGALRRAVSALAGPVFRTLVTGDIYDTQCGFKAFRGDVADGLFAISRVDGFAVDVELIYLLLKHRLDIKRIPVQLRRNEGSTVRVIRDSSRAAADILSMRLAWARGRYRSRLLENLHRGRCARGCDGEAPISAGRDQSFRGWAASRRGDV